MRINGLRLFYALVIRELEKRYGLNTSQFRNNEMFEIVERRLQRE